MTKTNANAIIDSYCDDEPTEGAVLRLMKHEIEEFEGLNEPGSAGVQDRLDAILYA